MSKIITVTSGKGGVGKTGISLNLSLSLAQKGYKVCLFDADLGLANVNIITGLFPEYGLEEVIQGNKSLSEIIIKNYQGIDIIPGSSGVQKMADLSAEESTHLAHAFIDMDGYDYFIIDTSAGISSQVLSFCRACHEMILIITPEPTSLTDAYSLLKVLGSKGKDLPNIKVIVNQVKNTETAQTVYKKLKNTVFRFLSIKLTALGVVAYDPKVRAAIIAQTPFLLAFPDSAASRCIHSLTKKMTQKSFLGKKMSMELFWQNCLELCSGKKKKASANKKKKTLDKSSVLKLEQPSAAPDGKAGIGHLATTVNGMESKISMLSQEISQMHSLLIQLVNKQESSSKPQKINEDRESWENSDHDSEDCVFVPLKVARGKDTDGLKAMEAELPEEGERSIPKSNNRFFDFESWLHAKSNASH